MASDATLLSGEDTAVDQDTEKTATKGKRRSAELDKKELLNALVAFKRGDFSVRLDERGKGIDAKIAETFNSVVEINQRMSKELWRMSKVVGREGKIDERAGLGQVRGAWGGMVDSINTLISDLVWPTSETARVIGAVAKPLCRCQRRPRRLPPSRRPILQSVRHITISHDNVPR